ncbi:MAG: SDR family oxidoreductase [Leptospirales bacterium]|jgi:citronellol/citronellal dehydrogenase
MAATGPRNTESLKDRVVIITGASRGIGYHTALALAGEGAKIVVAAKSTVEDPKLPGTVQQTVADIEAAGGEALGLPCDVREEAELEDLVQRTLARFERIDALINNAGAIWVQPIEATPAKRFDLVHEVNYRAPYLLSRLVIPHMRRGGWGHILNMSPPIDTSAIGGKIAYMNSKFNMTGLTYGLAAELKKENAPIAVNSLWPKTLIESLATINWSMGAPKDWRKASIMADAVTAVFQQPPGSYSGQALIDEDVLRETRGVTDFSPYNVVEGGEPVELTWATFDAIIEQMRRPK